VAQAIQLVRYPVAAAVLGVVQCSAKAVQVVMEEAQARVTVPVVAVAVAVLQVALGQ
jgi:hypothetical protein